MTILVLVESFLIHYGLIRWMRCHNKPKQECDKIILFSRMLLAGGSTILTFLYLLYGYEEERILDIMFLSLGQIAAHMCKPVEYDYIVINLSDFIYILFGLIYYFFIFPAYSRLILILGISEMPKFVMGLLQLKYITKAASKTARSTDAINYVIGLTVLFVIKVYVSYLAFQLSIGAFFMTTILSALYLYEEVFVGRNYIIKNLI